MKYLIVLVAAGVIGYMIYDRQRSADVEVIESPVYAELRAGMQVEGRDIDMVLFAEMAGQQDCEARADRTWHKIIEDCKGCTMTLSSCKTELEPRYRRLFEDTPIHSTYLSFKRGAPSERNGRMVIYGLTADEGDAICGTMKNAFASRYEGTVSCIPGRRD